MVTSVSCQDVITTLSELNKVGTLSLPSSVKVLKWSLKIMRFNEEVRQGQLTIGRYILCIQVDESIYEKKKTNRKDLNIPTTQAINGRG